MIDHRVLSSIIVLFSISILLLVNIKYTIWIKMQVQEKLENLLNKHKPYYR